MVVKDRPAGLALRWDHYLTEKDKSLSSHEGILRFRKDNWKGIRDALRLKHGWIVTDKGEPHWVAPAGGAKLFQPVERRVTKERQDENGETVKYAVFELTGEWEMFPTIDYITCNNAGVLANYFAKGFRTRPPLDGVEDSVYRGVESAVPLEADATDVPKLWCRRHGGDEYSFVTWSAYIQHCVRRNEPPDEEAPVEVIERLSRAPFACYQHDQTFKDERQVAVHIKDKRCGSFVSPVLRVDQMKITQTNSHKEN